MKKRRTVREASVAVYERSSDNAHKLLNSVRTDHGEHSDEYLYTWMAMNVGVLLATNLLIICADGTANSDAGAVEIIREMLEEYRPSHYKGPRLVPPLPPAA